MEHSCDVGTYGELTIEERPMMSNTIKCSLPDSHIHEDSVLQLTGFTSSGGNLTFSLLFSCTNQLSRHSGQLLNLLPINYVATIAQMPRQDVRMILIALLTLINGGQKLLQK